MRRVAQPIGRLELRKTKETVFYAEIDSGKVEQQEMAVMDLGENPEISTIFSTVVENCRWDTFSGRRLANLAHEFGLGNRQKI